MKRRSQSSTERDLASPGRKEREAAPEFVEEECTGRHDGEELEHLRARRPTPERLRRLESKQDDDRKAHQDLAKLVNETRVELAGVRGELKVLPELVELIKGKSADEQKTERVRLNTRAKIIIALVGLGSAGLGLLAGGVL